MNVLVANRSHVNTDCFSVQVQIFDQVMLESVKSPGHFLHASEPYQIDHFTTRYPTARVFILTINSSSTIILI